ncbi:hypothetical protein [Hahella chejuensis]|nr:hypothetical protein [Hahella chejuensis]
MLIDAPASGLSLEIQIAVRWLDDAPGKSAAGRGPPFNHLVDTH